MASLLPRGGGWVGVCSESSPSLGRVTTTLGGANWGAEGSGLSSTVGGGCGCTSTLTRVTQLYGVISWSSPAVDGTANWQSSEVRSQEGVMSEMGDGMGRAWIWG